MQIDAYLKNEDRFLTTYQEALDFLDGYALRLHPRLKELPRLEVMRRLLTILGEPQQTFHLIHLAGTSGKGSTATMIARLLETTGQRVGLEVSPHFFDIRERMQVNGELPSTDAFVQTLNKIIPALRVLSSHNEGLPSYFGLLTAMAMQFFADSGVQYAVVETGIGGRFDFTNAIDARSKIAVLTKIGMDHMNFLGDTLEKITHEKVGIIRPGGEVFSLRQEADVPSVIEQACQEQQAHMHWTRRDQEVREINVDERGTSFEVKTDGGNWKDVRLGLMGEHQAENAGLALNVFEYIAQRDGLKIDPALIRSVLAQLSFVGRSEVIHQAGKILLFDVAHNPQKMKALCQMVQQVWPNTEPHFVIAFGHDAQSEAMLNVIHPVARNLTCADFVVGEGEYRYKFKDAPWLAHLATGLGYANVETALTPAAAWERILASKQSLIVITGSLHFVAIMKSLLTK